MWTDTEMSPLKDIKVWKLMSPEEQMAYKYALAGLTLLDTKQNIGMGKIADVTDDLQAKAVLSFMGMMEAIHAKSYSTIFTTLLVKEQINELFDDWIPNNRYLQYKAERITRYYDNINSPKDYYMALVASVYLESYLFYSGFFYPLYLAGQAQGRMIHSGEIINLILRDESIHGLYVGLLAQSVYQNLLTDEEREEVDKESIILLEDLMENEYSYTEELYAPIFLDTEVKRFLRYNANKALMNLGKEAYYEHEEINPIVQNGIETTTVTHDFFSVKGNGYIRGKVEPLRDEDFVMNTEDEFIVE
jgi:ribonucleoside-diphosphate reductase beta chain